MIGGSTLQRVINFHRKPCSVDGCEHVAVYPTNQCYKHRVYTYDNSMLALCDRCQKTATNGRSAYCTPCWFSIKTEVHYASSIEEFEEEVRIIEGVVPKIKSPENIWKTIESTLLKIMQEKQYDTTTQA